MIRVSLNSVWFRFRRSRFRSWGSALGLLCTRSRREVYECTLCTRSRRGVGESIGDGDADDDIALAALAVDPSANAVKSLYALAEGISNVDSARATLGASMSRLEYAADNLTNVAQNSAAARSRIMDADYAAETTELARTQIIQQAGTAMLAQANQSQQAVLALLR